MFKLDTRLENDTLAIGDFELCTVRLMNDARYPWIILIPKREGLSEIFQLSDSEQILLTKESTFVAQKLAELVSADKMNVAALGNIVNQLHLHHIARFREDEAWPAPVWGKGQAVPYSLDEKDILIEQLKIAFAELSKGDE